MSEEKVNKVRKMFVSFDDRDDAKMAGCRWDSVKKCWYMYSWKYDIVRDQCAKFRLYALIDNSDHKDNKKELNCKWNSSYKKWTISKHDYDSDPMAYVEANIRILTELSVYYNYELPPVKSDEEQLEELIKIMGDVPISVMIVPITE